MIDYWSVSIELNVFRLFLKLFILFIYLFKTLFKTLKTFLYQFVSSFFSRKIFKLANIYNKVRIAFTLCFVPRVAMRIHSTHLSSIELSLWSIVVVVVVANYLVHSDYYAKD